MMPEATETCRSAISWALACILSAGCYRTESSLDYVLACPPQDGIQRFVIPFEIKGMGSAHYPGPPYSYESFDVLVMERPEFRSSSEGVRQVLRYRAEWPLDHVRGSVLNQGGSLRVELQFLARGTQNGSAEWREYPLNGTYRVVKDDCREFESFI